tara:strand:- start:2965 stop:3468 length:504 start_codon:yes stop_codon:yes gene_type:complete
MSKAPTCALGVTFFHDVSDMNAFFNTYRESLANKKAPLLKKEHDFVRRFTITRNIYHKDVKKVMKDICEVFPVSYLCHTEGGIQFKGYPNKNVRFGFSGECNNENFFCSDASPNDLALKFTEGLPSIAWENNLNVRFRGITDKSEARVVTLALVNHFNLLPFFQDFI